MTTPTNQPHERQRFEERDADQLLTQAYFDAAERMLGWPHSRDEDWQPLLTRSDDDKRALYLTLTRLAAQRRSEDVAFGRWARHFAADWHQLAATAGLDHDDARQRYAIPADNTADVFLPQEPGV